MSENIPTSQGSSKPTKRTDALLLTLLIASLSLNVYLGWKVRLKNASGNQGAPVRLVPGMKIEPLLASDLDGKQQTISYADIGKPTVLYFLSPTCEWCERNTQNIVTLASLKGEHFRFIGISLDDLNLKQYVDAHHLNFPVYKNLTPDSIRMLGLLSTPQTIVIAPDGRVLKNWIGVYAQRSQPDVEAFFGVRLPGLTPGSN